MAPYLNGDAEKGMAGEGTDLDSLQQAPDLIVGHGVRRFELKFKPICRFWIFFMTLNPHAPLAIINMDT